MKTLCWFFACVCPVVVQAQSITSPQEKIREKVIAFRQELERAAVGRDETTLTRLLTNDFVFVHGTGVLEGKDEWIRRTVAGQPTYVWQESEPVEERYALRVYGNHTAVYIKTSTRVLPPDSLLRTMRSTAVYVNTGNGWQWASTHTALITNRPKAVDLSSALLTQYEGDYQTPNNRRLRIIREGQRLYVHSDEVPKREIIPVSQTQFVPYPYGLDESPQFTFAPLPLGGMELVRTDGKREWWRAKKVK